MRGLLACSVALSLAGCRPSSDEAAFDLILRDGLLIDGSGSPGERGSVAIRDGRIVEVGALTTGSAERVIDANGRVIAPGFIDMMGGSTIPLLRDAKTAESKLRQGITTMMAGEGGSLAPQSPDTFGDLAEGLPEGTRWVRFAEYFDLLEQKGVALNVVHNVGAAQVRRVVLGDEEVQPTAAQLEQMKTLVEQAMQDGAVGISTALIYPPGTYAKTEELVALASVAAAHGGVYFTHMRNESGTVVEAIEEALRIGRESGIAVHIYHLKAAGQENWPLMEKAIETIATARNEGLEVTADIYPYIRNGIGLGSFLHPRHYASGEDPFLATLSDPEVRAQLRREVEETSDWENWYRHVGKNWDSVLVSRVGPDTDPEFAGLSIQQIAERRGVDAWQAFFDLVQAGGTSVNPKSMNEEQKHLAMQAPFICFDNDAAPMNPETAAGAHPRAFGAFPRILAKYVRAEGVMALEDAIHKLTVLPARILRLEGRGSLAPGMAADLVIFDPEKVKDTATFVEPLSYAEGIDFVIVNGDLVIDDGVPTGALPGTVVR